MRRRVFLGSLVAASAFAGGGIAIFAVQRRSVAPENFGARGDGTTDDTRALQRALEAAGPGGILRLRSEAVYRIDTNADPTGNSFGGLKLGEGQTLELNGAELKALPSDQTHGAVVQAHGVAGWSILGPGRITGERDVHRGSAGEWGMGIAALGSNDWTIGAGVVVSNCWGDGIYLGRREGGGLFCERFLIEDVEVSNCRRNGISIVGGRDGEVRRVHIHHIGGTSPEGAIDMEPDDPRLPNRNIRIRDSRIHDTPAGIYLTVANEDILITGMQISCSNTGILFSERSDNVRIIDNPRIESTSGGTEGAAIRTVTGNPPGISNIEISRNGLYGGGFYVIFMFGVGYRNVVIDHNQIHASNPNVRGIAWLGTSRFTNNVGIVEAVAGFPNEYLVVFDQVSFGGNSFRNLSRFGSTAVFRAGSRDLGGNTFPPPRR